MKTILLAAALGTLPAWTSAALLGGGEWFINQDPGFGNGTPFPTPAAATASLPLTVPPEQLEALAQGAHLLGVRVREAGGEWNHVLWRPFIKDAAPDTVVPERAEWFVNADPGGGNGGMIALNEELGGALIPTADLADGVHLLGTRALDSAGRWGATVWRPFHVEGPRLAAIKYEIVRGGEVVHHDSAPNGFRGAGLSLAVEHGKTALELDAPHVLRAIPVAGDGRLGEPVEADFDYRRYAEAWLTWHFNADERDDPGKSGWQADPDHDGWDNLREMSFVLDPRRPGDASLASLPNDDPHQFSFRVPAGGVMGEDGIYRVSDLSYRLRESDALSGWLDVPATAISHWSLSVVPGDREAARLEIRVADNSLPRRFFVLLAER